MRIIDADHAIKLILEERNKLSPQFRHDQSMKGGIRKALRCIEESPTIDAVSIGVYEQVRWERDVAIAQLEELGIGFGQKKPDMVEVVHCKNCEHWGTGYVAETDHVKECEFAHYMVGENGYCVYGEVQNEDKD